MALKRRAAAVASSIVLILLALGLLAPVALAQNYSFGLPDNRLDVTLNQDGTALYVFDMTFAPVPGSSPIDVADVHLPNDTYNLSEVKASVDGVPLSDIQVSPYAKPGIAVGLGAHAIQPGQTGSLHVEVTVRDVLYQDSQDQQYASFEFAPNWFDSQFVRGTSRLEVNLHFPPGVTQDEPRYHKVPFTSATVQNDRVVYTWVDNAASGGQTYVFGASFPKQYVAAGAIQKPPAFNINFGSLCSSPVIWIGLFVLGWVVLGALGSRSQQRRKMDYLPPSLAVEGAGVKRGLTAVEAAILLEAPLGKVMSMILFGLVKKGVLTVEAEKPLRVKPLAELPQDVTLWPYEKSFLAAVKPDGTTNENDLREMVITLIGDVNKKLTGFSRKETEAYYKDIAARAWKEVEAADTPEVLGERWSDGLEWTMLDDDWDRRTRRVFADRPVVLPVWWWGYGPWIAAAGHPARPAVPAPTVGGGGIPVTLPTLPGADFANTVVRGVENTANTVVSSIESFTGKITQKTNPPPKPTSSSSSRGGGGGYSCACACACAGCACACAGGGR